MILFSIVEFKKARACFSASLKPLVLDKDNAKYFGRKPGDKIARDTAWQISSLVKKAGYDGIALPVISPRIDKSQIKFMTEDMRGEEHHLDGVPIFTHVGRGHTRDFFNNSIVVKWKNRVEEWLSRI